jgi:hypothetical protein
MKRGTETVTAKKHKKDHVNLIAKRQSRSLGGDFGLERNRVFLPGTE